MNLAPNDSSETIIEADAQDVAEASVAAADQKLSLPSGEALSEKEVVEFLAWRPASIVAIVGDGESGKSTLICSIYDRFLRGPFASGNSCGIRTIVGLEKQVHLERLDSGRQTPETARTTRADGLRYFHFPVTIGSLATTRRDVILSDRAGELYKQARSNSSAIQQLAELRLASRVVLLMDGARLAIPSERAGAMQVVRQMIQALLDGNVLIGSSCVQVVVTKMDLVAAAEDNLLIHERLAAFKTRLSADFSAKLSELTFWEIAARDPTGGFPPAFGVADLFQRWLTNLPDRISVPTESLRLSTEFDKLAFRNEPEVVGA